MINVTDDVCFALQLHLTTDHQQDAERSMLEEKVALDV